MTHTTRHMAYDHLLRAYVEVDPEYATLTLVWSKSLGRYVTIPE